MLFMPHLLDMVREILLLLNKLLLVAKTIHTFSYEHYPIETYYRVQVDLNIKN